MQLIRQIEYFPPSLPFLFLFGVVGVDVATAIACTGANWGDDGSDVVTGVDDDAAAGDAGGDCPICACVTVRFTLLRFSSMR